MDKKRFSGKRICVAISGGVDSVVLLHWLKKREKDDGYVLSAVHCEHGIRGEESLEDMRFVERYCKESGVPLYVFSDDCPARAKREKLSLETAAREFRYESFLSLIEQDKVDYVATAHHENDEAETVLFRLARGASLTGAKGMSEENGYLLRPLLGWSRAEIEAYAKENGLCYRVDRTNFEADATRNKLRLFVLSQLEEAVPGAAGNLARFARIAAEDDELLYEYAENLIDREMENGGVLVAFCSKKPLLRRACLLAMKEAGIEKDYTAAHLDALVGLQNCERGARVSLPKNVVAEKTDKGLLFSLKREEILPLKTEEKTFDKTGYDGGRYEVKLSFDPFEEEENGWKILRVDADKIPKSAVFRFRKEGDEIKTFGGTKTLKKLFNERKTAVRERSFLPLIAESEGK